MEIELSCRACECRFSAPAQTSAEEVLDRMTEEGPWYALGTGACFRDMVRTALSRRGRLDCPECGRRVVISTRRLAEAVPVGS
jgi:hypothetical protein